jgi:hypothetical protein
VVFQCCCLAIKLGGLVQTVQTPRSWAARQVLPMSRPAVPLPTRTLIRHANYRCSRNKNTTRDRDTVTRSLMMPSCAATAVTRRRSSGTYESYYSHTVHQCSRKSNQATIRQQSNQRRYGPFAPLRSCAAIPAYLDRTLDALLSSGMVESKCL